MQATQGNARAAVSDDDLQAFGLELGQEMVHAVQASRLCEDPRCGCNSCRLAATAVSVVQRIKLVRHARKIMPEVDSRRAILGRTLPHTYGQMRWG